MKARCAAVHGIQPAALAEPHPMTCGHSPLPPSRQRSFGRGAQCSNVAYCSPTTNPSAPLAGRTSPHDLRSFPSPSQSLPLLRERGTMQQRRLLFAHNKPLYTPRSTSKASARERGGRAAPGVRSFTVSSTGKLMNLRTLHPSLNERSECPGEGWARQRPG